MATPYSRASRCPSLLLSDRFIKKLTVIGIIGQTQGVSKAKNPPSKPARKISHSDVAPEVPSPWPKLFSSLITGFQ